MTRVRRLVCRVLGHDYEFKDADDAIAWLKYETPNPPCRRCGQ